MMMKTTLIATSALALALAAPNLASAESIKDLVPADVIAAYCATAGVNTETVTSFKLASGETVMGSVHCEAENMPGALDPSGTNDASGSDDGPNHDATDDNGGDDDATGSDDSSNDDASDDNGGDDDHGDDSGHDEGDDD